MLTENNTSLQFTAHAERACVVLVTIQHGGRITQKSMIFIFDPEEVVSWERWPKQAILEGTEGFKGPAKVV